MSEVDGAEVAARFVACQEALLTELERAAGASGAGESLERAAERCAEAFEVFKAAQQAGAPMPVDTVSRARRLAALLSARAESRSADVVGELGRTRAAKRSLDSAAAARSDFLGGGCDISG